MVVQNLLFAINGNLDDVQQFTVAELNFVGSRVPTSEELIGASFQSMHVNKMGVFYVGIMLVPNPAYDFTSAKIKIPLSEINNYPRYPAMIPTNGTKLGVTCVAQAQVNMATQFEFFAYELYVEDDCFTIEMTFPTPNYSGIQLTHVYPFFNFNP